MVQPIDSSTMKHEAQKQNTSVQSSEFTLDASRNSQSSANQSHAGWWLTYATFFFAGASAVAVWSSITLSLDYFQAQFPNESVGFVFPVVNMSTLLSMTLFMVLSGRQIGLDARMHFSLMAYLIFVVAIPVASLLSLPGKMSYALTLLAIVGSTISSSVLQATIYGIGGVFGASFLQAVEGGKGFGAILLFIFRLLLKAAIGTSSEDTEYAMLTSKVEMATFFSITFGMIFFTWLLYISMKRTEYAEPLMREYLLVQHDTTYPTEAFSPINSPRSDDDLDYAANAEQQPLLSTNGGRSDTSVRSSGEWNTRHYDTTIAPVSPSSHFSTSGAEIAYAVGDDDELDEMLNHAESATVLAVLHAAGKPFFTLFLSYFVCLACFPGLISAVPSVTLGLGDWFPVVLVGCYNVGDLVGKNIVVYKMLIDVRSLYLVWPLQVAFIPFFILAVIHPMDDIVQVIAVLLLGLVTGYVATSCVILAPSVCSEYQKEVAGMVGGLSAIVGLCAGSYGGLLIEMLVQLYLGRSIQTPSAPHI